MCKRSMIVNYRKWAHFGDPTSNLPNSIHIYEHSVGKRLSQTNLKRHTNMRKTGYERDRE